VPPVFIVHVGRRHDLTWANDTKNSNLLTKRKTYHILVCSVRCPIVACADGRVGKCVPTSGKAGRERSVTLFVFRPGLRTSCSGHTEVMPGEMTWCGGGKPECPPWNRRPCPGSNGAIPPPPPELRGQSGKQRSLAEDIAGRRQGTGREDRLRLIQGVRHA